MSDEKYYDQERDGFYRDVTTMEEGDREDWRDSDPDGYENNLARQIHSESEQRRSGRHSVHPYDDDRVLDVQEDRTAHGGVNSIIAERLGEARNPDPMDAGFDCIRTVEDDIKFAASRMRRKTNIE